MKKSVLLLSGGMDSISALFLLKPDYAINVNLCIKYNQAERKSVNYFIEKYKKLNGVNKTKFIFLDKILDLSRYELEDNTIPMRNLYLITLAVNEIIVLENNNKDLKLEVILVVQKDEMSIPDRSFKFFNDFNKLLQYLTGIDIRLNLPFCLIDKTEILSQVIKEYNNALAASIYYYSYSCYNISDKITIECGNCPACFRKWVAGVNNGFYNNIFNTNPYYSDIKLEYLNKLDKYSKDRQNRILSAIKSYEHYLEINRIISNDTY